MLGAVSDLGRLIFSPGIGVRLVRKIFFLELNVDSLHYDVTQTSLLSMLTGYICDKKQVYCQCCLHMYNHDTNQSIVNVDRLHMWQKTSLLSMMPAYKHDTNQSIVKVDWLHTWHKTSHLSILMNITIFLVGILHLNKSILVIHPA